MVSEESKGSKSRFVVVFVAMEQRKEIFQALYSLTAEF
jgi:hypothetical protein